MTRPLALFTLLLCLTLSACDKAKDKTKPPKKIDKKKSAKKVDPGKKATKKKDRDPSDPFDPEDPKVLFDIFRGFQMKGDAKQRVLIKYQLVDANGQLHSGREDAFKDAVRAYAKDHPKEWSDFVLTLEARDSDK